MNLPFYLITSILMLLIGRQLKLPLWLSCMLAIIWAMNSACIDVVTEIRQYSLLALIASCYCLSLVDFYRCQRLRAYIQIGLAILLGMLCHYHFALLLVPSLLILYAQMAFRREWKTVLRLSAMIAVAALAFLLLHSNFYASFGQSPVKRQAFAEIDAPYRIFLSIRALGSVFLPTDIAQSITRYGFLYFPFALGVGVIGVTGFALLVVYPRCKTLGKRWPESPVFTIAAGSLVTMLAILFLYLYGYSPKHAMGAKYMILVSPILYMVIGSLLGTAVYKRGKAVGIGLGIVILAHLTYNVVAASQDIQAICSPKRNPIAGHPNACVIVDTVRRGVLPSILWSLEPDTRVFAAGHTAITEQVLQGTSDGDSIFYVSNSKPDILPEHTKRILGLFASRGYRIKQVQSDYWTQVTFQIEMP